MTDSLDDIGIVEQCHDAHGGAAVGALERIDLADLLNQPGPAGFTSSIRRRLINAFQQVGDETVAGLSRAYRDAVRRRDRMTGRVAFLSPAVAVQRSLQRLAETDTAAGLAFDTRVRAYHEKLRRFWYPLIFNDEKFDPARLSAAPTFEDGEDR